MKLICDLNRLLALKYLLFIAVTGSFYFTANAGELDREFRRNIEMYDVPKQLRHLNSSAAVDFWETLVRFNMKLYQLNSDIAKGNGAEKEAVAKTEAHLFHPQYTWWVDDAAQNYCDSLFNVFGLAKMAPHSSIHLTRMDDVSSFVALKENGFAICLSYGMLNAKGFNGSMLAGVIAHEYAHGLLRHMLSVEYDKAKRKRTEAVLKGFAATLGVAAVGLAAYNNAQSRASGAANISNTNIIVDNSVNVNDNIIVDGNGWRVEDLFWYGVSFKKEQILEADLIAFRFLEYMGYGGGSYLELLKLNEANETNVKLSLRGNDYPTAQYRIKFLEYVMAHPEIENTVNDDILDCIKKAKINEISRRQAF